MKVHASLKNVRIAPRKVRLVTHAIVGMEAREALIQLESMVKKSFQPVRDLLKSAVANATNNNGLDEANLYIWEIRVGDGLRLKRSLPRAFGRATPLLRRGSNVTIILEEKIEGKNRVAKKKVTPVVSESGKPPVSEGRETKVGHRTIKPEVKKEIIKGAKPAGIPAGKKMFQRKAV